MIRRPPRSTRTDTLFPYTTLFRSAIEDRRIVEAEMPQHEPRPCRSGVRGIVADHDMAVVADAKCAPVPPKLFGVGNRGRQRIGRVAPLGKVHEHRARYVAGKIGRESCGEREGQYV